MTSRALPLALVLAFLVPVAAGCQTMSDDELQHRTQEVGYDTVVFTDYDLNQQFQKGLLGPDEVIRVSAQKHGIRRTETGTSEVWVVLRNHTDHAYMVQARTSFYTDGGMPTDARAAWKRVVVPANALATYREKSVSTQRLRYRVEVRQVK